MITEEQVTRYRASDGSKHDTRRAALLHMANNIKNKGEQDLLEKVGESLKSAIHSGEHISRGRAVTASDEDRIKTAEGYVEDLEKLAKQAREILSQAVAKHG